MMKTNGDKVKKKVWEKPVIKMIPIKNTQGGKAAYTYEDAFYNIPS